MSDILLRDLLTLEPLESNYFRGQSWDLGFPALFGGQVMAQALAAAQNTVETELSIHSMHCLFLLPGDASHPVFYQVERIRNGRSFSARTVTAVQHGRVIFTCNASFQVTEQGLEHQSNTMPDVPAPDELVPDIQYFEDKLANMASSFKEQLNYHRPIDIRTVQTIDPLNPVPTEAKRYVWMRLTEDQFVSPAFQHVALTYASDYHFLITALQPHGLSVFSRSIKAATIDHGIWFHKPMDFRQWHLYCTDSPTSGGARGFVRGQYFTEQGELVASTAQEGLMRPRTR